MNTENPIATCAAMLSLRHFSALQDFARRLPSSDCVARIIAIADVLSAPDFYSVLQLRLADAGDLDLTRRQFAKLALLLDPTSTDKFPFSDEALARAREAWLVLSDPERRALYDRELEQQRRLRGGDSETATFWTGCPYCANLYEYEKRYEHCTLLCQKCQKAFYGVAVKPPVKKGEERGEDYWIHESLPMRYYEAKEKEDDKNVMDELEKVNDVVYISDDDDDDFADEGLGKKVEEGVKGDVRSEGWERVHQVNETVNLQGNGMKRMRIKTVAKKGVWNRNNRSKQGCVDADSDLDLDVEDGELEFTQRDGDVFVGVQFNK